METTIAGLLAFGKGILAADESFPTIGKRFTALDIPVTEENRRAYRELLVKTPGLSDFISGVILFDETIRQQTSSGETIPEALCQRGIIPGIKVDKSTVALANFPGEKVTQGLDDLLERLSDYRSLGARFTKWRAVFAISKSTPSQVCIEANANMLALFASLSQEAGLVPIVEPEVLMDGDHSIERCEEVITTTLKSVFSAFFEQRVTLEHMLLKTAMVLPGTKWPEQSGADDIAMRTLRCFKRAVPMAVPGIVFLSGGQDAAIATQRLNEICRVNDGPWTLSFSFGRALQTSALDLWAGRSDGINAAQQALHQLARDNSYAVQGTYSANLELDSLSHSIKKN